MTVLVREGNDDDDDDSDDDDDDGSSRAMAERVLNIVGKRPSPFQIGNSLLSKPDVGCPKYEIQSQNWDDRVSFRLVGRPPLVLS